MNQSLATIEVPQVFESYLAGQLTEGTRKIYRTDLLEFFGGNMPSLEMVRSISVDQIVAWRNQAWSNGTGRLAASTINRKLVALKSFMDLLLAAGVVPINPAHPKLVRRIKEKSGSAQLGITKDEFKALLEACSIGENSRVNARDRALISLLYSCLLRRSEAHGFNWNHLARDGGRSILRLPHTKAGANDFTPIEPEMILVLEDYFQALGGAKFWLARYGHLWKQSAPVFVALDNGNRGGRLSTNGINEVAKRRAKLAGIQPISAHTIRHTSITHLLMEGHSLADVQSLARHSDPKQTMAYAALLRRIVSSPAKTLASALRI